jgi:hypothetical protein
MALAKCGTRLLANDFLPSLRNVLPQILCVGRRRIRKIHTSEIGVVPSNELDQDLTICESIRRMPITASYLRGDDGELFGG